MLAQRTFQSSAVPLNYVQGPAAGPALLLLHGVTQRWQAFLPLLPQLMLTHQVFAVDFRGHGLSGQVKNGYGGEHYAQDIIEFIDEVIKQPVIVFGHSLGGMVSLYVGGRRPKLMRGLIVGDCWLFGGNPNRTMYAEMFQKTLALLNSNREFDALKRELPEMTIHSPVYGEVAMKSIPRSDAAYLTAWARSLSQMDPEAIASALDRKVMESWRPEEFLRAVKCPTLLMQADPKMGGLMSDDDVKRARELLADSIHVRMEGMGHSLHISDAAPVARVVGNFLASI